MELTEFLKQIVETMGIIPKCAQDGETAFEMFKKEKPDIIISDIYMPKLNGLDLLKKIKTINPKIPIILITGYAHYKQLIEKLDT